MRRLCVLALCAAIHTLALSTACGGGGDNQPPDAGPPPPPPPPDAGPPDAGPKPDAGPLDLLPPTVVSFTPPHGATDVPPETQIEVNFSETMLPDRGTLQIIPGTGFPNGGLIPARLENWDPPRRTARFSFPAGLPLRSTLQVSLANFSDLAGNPMQGTVSFTFTVSAGSQPTVSSSSPAEGASGVSLNTREVVFNFSQPMDTTVGTLTPGGGLALGTPFWVGNQTLKAPITSTLVDNGLYSVRLDNYRNVNARLLDGTVYLGDGKLDFGTGPDTIAPQVRSTSPEEGSPSVQYESTQFVVINFSEPMNTTAGAAELVDVANGTRTTLSPNWSGDGFSVAYNVQFRLRPGAAMRVTLAGFRDRANNLLNTAGYLGANGALDFTVVPDTVKPFVTGTNIPDGTTGIYPAEVFATGGTPSTGFRKVFTFQFNEPMNTAVTRVTLHETLNPGATPRAFTGVWNDSRNMTVTVLPATQGTLPLLEDTPFYLDVTELKDVAGNFVDAQVPPLGDGHLDFRTSLSDTDLNHACQDALTQPLTPIAATATVTTTTPRTDAFHTLYRPSMPTNGTSFTGFTKGQISGTQRIFFSGPVQLLVTDPQNPGQGIPVTQTAVPPACDQLTHENRFPAPIAPELNLRFTFSQQTFRMVLEPPF
jgi:hypothetical protein